MKNTTLYVLSLAAATASCGYSRPYQNSGPTLSKEGVQVTLMAQECHNNRADEQYPTALIDDQLHVGVKLQVTNQSNHVARLSLSAFQLEAGSGREHTVMHPKEDGVVSLSPGQSTNVALNFAEETELDCHHDLALDVQGAVAIEGRPTYLASIHFLPSP